MHTRPLPPALSPMLAAAVLVAGLAAAAPAAAAPDQPLPTLFGVTGVSAGSTLNIRAAPGTAHPVIGSLAPDARDIEVVARDATGGWGRINTGERSGWVALNYMTPQPGVWAAGAVPAGLRCFGTEPFWSLQPRGDGVAFTTPDDPEGALPMARMLDTGIPGDPRRTITAGDAVRTLTAVIVPAACSDGMSDRAFGLDATVIVDEGGVARMLTGCCSVAPR